MARNIFPWDNLTKDKEAVVKIHEYDVAESQFVDEPVINFHELTEGVRQLRFGDGSLKPYSVNITGNNDDSTEEQLSISSSAALPTDLTCTSSAEDVSRKFDLTISGAHEENKPLQHYLEGNRDAEFKHLFSYNEGIVNLMSRLCSEELYQYSLEKYNQQCLFNPLGISIAAETIERLLDPREWIKAETISFFVELLHQLRMSRVSSEPETKFFSSYFYSTLTGKSGQELHTETAYNTLKKPVKNDFFKEKKFVFPCFIKENHFIVVCVDFKDHKVSLYDSANDMFNEMFKRRRRKKKAAESIVSESEENRAEPMSIMRNFLLFISYCAQRKTIEFNENDWSLDVVDTTQQKDGVNCGVYTIMYLAYIFDNIPVPTSKDTMTPELLLNWRKSIFVLMVNNHMLSTPLTTTIPLEDTAVVTTADDFLKIT